MSEPRTALCDLIEEAQAERLARPIPYLEKLVQCCGELWPFDRIYWSHELQAWGCKDCMTPNDDTLAVHFERLDLIDTGPQLIDKHEERTDGKPTDKTCL